MLSAAYLLQKSFIDVYKKHLVWIYNNSKNYQNKKIVKIKLFCKQFSN